MKAENNKSQVYTLDRIKVRMKDNVISINQTPFRSLAKSRLNFQDFQQNDRNMFKAGPFSKPVKEKTRCSQRI